jgi:hypothetical protein
MLTSAIACSKLGTITYSRLSSAPESKKHHYGESSLAFCEFYCWQVQALLL